MAARAATPPNMSNTSATDEEVALDAHAPVEKRAERVDGAGAHADEGGPAGAQDHGGSVPGPGRTLAAPAK